MTVSTDIKIAYSSLSIKQLIDEFKQLAPLQEEKKLHIIEAFEAIIKHELILKSPRLSLIEKQSDVPFLVKPQEALYYLFLALGLIKNSVGSYMYGNTLFALIPGVSDPLLVFLSLIYLAVNTVLFYAFEVSFIKEALGIMDASTDLSLLLDIYSKQFKTTLVINKLFFTLPMLLVDDSTYDEYVELVTLINKDLEFKRKNMGSYQEPTFKYYLRIGVLTFCGLTSVAESYFVANALMAAIAASLAVTPIGWGIIMLSISVDLAFNYAMAVSSMMQMVNPDYDNYQSIKKEWAQFDEKACQDNLVEVKFIKSRFLVKQDLSLFSHPSANESSYVHENNPLTKLNTMLGSERN